MLNIKKCKRNLNFFKNMIFSNILSKYFVFDIVKLIWSRFNMAIATQVSYVAPLPIVICINHSSCLWVHDNKTLSLYQYLTSFLFCSDNNLTKIQQQELIASYNYVTIHLYLHENITCLPLWEPIFMDCHSFFLQLCAWECI